MLGVKRMINLLIFNIIKFYIGLSIWLYYMDCYWFEGEEDDLGFDEYFEDNVIIVIEWSKFIKDFFFFNYLIINISVKDVNER